MKNSSDSTYNSASYQGKNMLNSSNLVISRTQSL